MVLFAFVVTIERPRFGDVTICGIDRGRGRLQRRSRRGTRWLPPPEEVGTTAGSSGCAHRWRLVGWWLPPTRPAPAPGTRPRTPPALRQSRRAGTNRSGWGQTPSDAELVLEHPWGEVPHQIRNHGDLTLHIERQEVVPVGGHHGAVAVGMMTVEQLEAGDGCSGELIQQITEPAPVCSSW